MTQPLVLLTRRSSWIHSGTKYGAALDAPQEYLSDEQSL